jgi:pimeloyl-ACP methyl ester carboxylesterase
MTQPVAQARGPDIDGGRAVSADGTKIAYLAIGGGPALVIVHGSLGEGLDWLTVAEQLRDQHRVVLVDRRGHGRSDEGTEPYSLEREAEDVLAVLDAVGPATIVGHSFGARVAMEAALRSAPGSIGRLMLYEPAFWTVPPRTLRESRAAVARGAYEEALVMMASALPGFSIPQRVRHNMRAWARLVRLAACGIREADAVYQAGDSAARYQAIAVPARLLLGTDSPAGALRGAGILREVLPDCGITLLEGHGHSAHTTAPGELAETIRELIFHDP